MKWKQRNSGAFVCPTKLYSTKSLVNENEQNCTQISAHEGPCLASKSIGIFQRLRKNISEI